MNKTLTDEHILEIGRRHFRPGHNVEAEASFIAAVRDVLAAHPGQPEPFTLASALEWAGVPDACRKDPEPRAEVTALITAAERVVEADRACALDDSDINALATAIDDARAGDAS